MMVYLVGYGWDYEGGTKIMGVYTNKQKADEKRQTLQDAKKGDYQFSYAVETDQEIDFVL